MGFTWTSCCLTCDEAGPVAMGTALSCMIASCCCLRCRSKRLSFLRLRLISALRSARTPSASCFRRSASWTRDVTAFRSVHPTS